MIKTYSIYTLTFDDGTSIDHQFTGYLQFKDSENAHAIVKAEMVRRWDEEVSETEDVKVVEVEEK